MLFLAPYPNTVIMTVASASTTTTTTTPGELTRTQIVVADSLLQEFRKENHIVFEGQRYFLSSKIWTQRVSILVVTGYLEDYNLLADLLLAELTEDGFIVIGRARWHLHSTDPGRQRQVLKLTGYIH